MPVSQDDEKEELTGLHGGQSAPTARWSSTRSHARGRAAGPSLVTSLHPVRTEDISARVTLLGQQGPDGRVRQPAADPGRAVAALGAAAVRRRPTRQTQVPKLTDVIVVHNQHDRAGADDAGGADRAASARRRRPASIASASAARRSAPAPSHADGRRRSPPPRPRRQSSSTTIDAATAPTTTARTGPAPAPTVQDLAQSGAGALDQADAGLRAGDLATYQARSTRPRRSSTRSTSSARRPRRSPRGLTAPPRVGGRPSRPATVSAHTAAGWSSLVARRAHNPKVVGSNPTPATNCE